MIDNKLKPCCETCNFLDIFTNQEVLGYMSIKPGENALQTTIGCNHMYVCKNYIECTEQKEPALFGGEE